MRVHLTADIAEQFQKPNKSANGTDFDLVEKIFRRGEKLERIKTILSVALQMWTGILLIYTFQWMLLVIHGRAKKICKNEKPSAIVMTYGKREIPHILLASMIFNSTGYSRSPEILARRFEFS